MQFQFSDSKDKVTWSAGGVVGGNATVGTIDAKWELHGSFGEYKHQLS